jgi:hypothetical protein
MLGLVVCLDRYYATYIGQEIERKKLGPSDGAVRL